MCGGSYWFCPFTDWHLQKPLLTWVKLSWQNIGREALLLIRGAKATKGFLCDRQYIKLSPVTDRQPMGVICMFHLAPVNSQAASLCIARVPHKYASPQVRVGDPPVFQAPLMLVSWPAGEIPPPTVMTSGCPSPFLPVKFKGPFKWLVEGRIWPEDPLNLIGGEGEGDCWLQQALHTPAL